MKVQCQATFKQFCQYPKCDCDRVRRPRELARNTGTYRWFLRNNAVKWHGVEPDRKVEHPPLVEKISQRGEKHYVELWH